MGRILTNSSYQRAQAVLAIMQFLVSNESDKEPDIRVRTLTTEHGDGLHFVVESPRRRMANVLGNNRSDGFIVNYGYANDYEFPSGKALDTVTRRVFDHGEAHLAAQMLVNWLENGSDSKPKKSL